MFSDRIGRIKPSATLAMTSKAAELKRANKPVYNMSVGEPDFSTPKNIQQAGIDAIKQGHTKYTPVKANLSYTFIDSRCCTKSYKLSLPDLACLE